MKKGRERIKACKITNNLISHEVSDNEYYNIDDNDIPCDGWYIVKHNF